MQDVWSYSDITFMSRLMASEGCCDPREIPDPNRMWYRASYTDLLKLCDLIALSSAAGLELNAKPTMWRCVGTCLNERVRRDVTLA